MNDSSSPTSPTTASSTSSAVSTSHLVWEWCKRTCTADTTVTTCDFQTKSDDDDDDNIVPDAVPDTSSSSTTITTAEQLNLLLLGGGGFVGVNLTERLVHDGTHNVVVVDLSDEKLSFALGEDYQTKHCRKLTYHSMDIGANNERLVQLITHCDVVINMVAVANPSIYVSDPYRVYELNFAQNMKIVEACRAHKKRLIQFSTSEVYGMTVGKAAAACGQAPTSSQVVEFVEDETPLIMGAAHNHRWIYASCKQLLDRVLFALVKRDPSFQFSIIRPFNFVGPHFDFLPSERNGKGSPRVMAMFMDSILFGNSPIRLVDGGASLRCYLLIQDAVDGIVRIIENNNGNCNGQVFNLGNPANELRTRDLAERMCDVFDEHFRQVCDPPRPKIVSVVGQDFYGKGYEDCDRRIPSIAKAQTLLGWQPTHDMDAVIYTTMEYFVARHRKRQAESK